MAEDLISSIIDNSAVEAEIKKVESRLDALATTIKTFPKAQVFYDSTGLKDLSAANKELSVVMKDLRVKNLELTNSIKEQQLAEKQLAAQRKQAIADAKDKANAEKEASRQAQIAGQEKLRQLAAEKKAQEDLASAEAKRNEAEEKALSGTFTAGSSAPKKTTEQFIPTTASDSLALSLVQDQRQLAATKEAQKLLSAEFKAGNISQAEYDAQIVKSIQLQNDLKVSIANTTKELSLQAKSNASIPGTIEALQTRNAVLGQQRDQISVVNASSQDIANLKGINDEIDKNNELIRVNKDLLAQQKINIGNYPTALGQTFKTLNTELEQVQGKLVQGNFGGKEFDQLTAKQTVLQNALSLSGQTFKSTAAEASAYKEAAIQIGNVYGKDSSIFKQFAEGVKTGAANTKALANEVAGVATKGKGFVSFLSAAWSGIRRLAYVIPGLGIGGVVLLLLGPLQAAGEALIKWSNNATKAGRDFQDLQQHIENTNAIVEKSADSFAKATSEVSKLKEDVKLAKDGFLDKDKVLKEYNETMGKTTGQLKNFDELEAKLVADGPDYIQLLFLKAKATAAYALAGEAARKALTAQMDAEKNFGQGDAAGTLFKNFGTLLKAAFGSQAEAAGEFGQEGVKQINKNAEDIKKTQEKAFKDLQEQANDFEKQAAELAKKHGWNFFDPNGENTKKGTRDLERLLDEFRKKTLKEQQEYLKVLDEAELKQYKLMADDQNQSLKERLESERKYYEKSLQMAKQNTQDQADAVDLEASIAAKRAGKITDPKKRAETLIAIEDYRVLAIKRISEEGNAAILKINRDFYNENVTIADQAYEKIKKAAEESQAFIQEQQKIAFQNQKDQVDIDKDNQLLQLEKDFQNGKIKNLEEYNQRKDDIETAADIKQKQLDLKRIQDAEKVFEALYGIQNFNLIKQAKDLEVEIEREGNKKILESQKELIDKSKELREQLEQTFQDVIEGGFDRRQQQNEIEAKAIQDKSQKEIDAINASGLAEADKEKRIMAIQKQADFQSQQIEKRQQQQDIARAKFERAMSIVRIIQNTAEAVSKAVAEFPLTGGMPFVAIDLAIGAAQIASVLAQPLPHFKKGTGNAPRGKAVVGEEGSELIVDKAGRMFVTPSKPTLIELAGGEKIFQHNITEDFLKHHNLLTILQKAQTQKQPVKVETGFNKKAIELLTKIERKAPFIIQVGEKMETTDYYLRNIKN
jgi:hypothetical protein